MNTIIGGLISVLTPLVFPFLIIIPVIFEKLGKSQKQHKSNIFFFGCLTITFFVVIMNIFFQAEDMNMIVEDRRPETVLSFMQIIFLIWFLLSFFKPFEKLHQTPWLLIFSMIGIVVLSCKLALISMATAGPIIGSIIISEVTNNDATNVIRPLLGFSIGLIIPFMIVQYFIQRHYQNLSSKKWWKILQISVAVYLIGGAMIKVFKVYGQTFI